MMLWWIRFRSSYKDAACLMWVQMGISSTRRIQKTKESPLLLRRMAVSSFSRASVSLACLGGTRILAVTHRSRLVSQPRAHQVSSLTVLDPCQSRFIIRLNKIIKTLKEEAAAYRQIWSRCGGFVLGLSDNAWWPLFLLVFMKLFYQCAWILTEISLRQCLPETIRVLGKIRLTAEDLYNLSTDWDVNAWRAYLTLD